MFPIINIINFMPFQINLEGDQPLSLEVASKEVWDTFKKFYVVNLTKGSLVKDPSSGGNIYSEGTGFGMLLSVQMGDQALFENLLNGAENYLKVKDQSNDNFGLYSWLARLNGNKVDVLDRNSAADADLDIAEALIQAQNLVDSGRWRIPKQGKNYYREKALELLGVIWEKEIAKIDYNKDGKIDLYILKPSASKWLGIDNKGAFTINPSYMSPAWYVDFAKVDKSHDWLSLRDSTYKIFDSILEETKDFIPDWCEVYIDNSGRITIRREVDHEAKNIRVFEQGFDGIRSLMRLSIDALWNKDQRAIKILKKLVYNKKPSEVFVIDSSGRKWHNELAVAMYAVAAFTTSSQTQALQFVNELQRCYKSGRGYFGLDDWAGAKDLYYNQTLCLFASLIISNNFKNIMAD